MPVRDLKVFVAVRPDGIVVKKVPNSTVERWRDWRPIPNQMPLEQYENLLKQDERINYEVVDFM